MFNYGKIEPGKTARFPFSTFDSNDPSASATATGLAVGDIKIYKDGSLTERASTAGYAVDTDMDAITGVHFIEIDLADNTTAGFFAVGSEYIVVVDSITVDAGVISFPVARFTIAYDGAFLNTDIATLSSQTSFTLTDGPADNDALNGCRMICHDVASSVQMCIGIVSDYVGSTKTVTLKADPGIFTMAATDGVSFFLPALTATTPGATLDVTSTGAAGIDWANVENPTTALDLSGTDIQLCDTITTYTGNTLQTGDSFARLGAPAGASVSADIATVDTVVDGIQTDLSNGTDGLGAIKADTAAILVDTAEIGAAGAGLTALATQASVNTVDSNVDAILLDTAEIGAAGAGLTAVPWNAAWDAEVQSEVDDALTAFGASTVTTAQVNTEVDNAIVTYGLDHLVQASVTGTDVANNSIIARLVSSSATADWDDFVNTSDSLQAIRDHIGDGTNLTVLATAAALSTVDTVVDGIQTDLDNGTDGLGAIKADTAAILTDTGTTLETHLTDIKGATFSGATDSLEAVRDRGDAAWTTGAGGTPPQLLQSTTIATLSTQTSFTLTAGSADDDAYNGAVVVVTDQSTAEQKAVGEVSDYTGSTKTVTLAADPGIFTMATGDTVDVIANVSTAPTAVQVRQEMDSNSTQLAAIVADTAAVLVDTADMQPKLGTPAGADISADIAAVKVDTAATLVDTGTTIPAVLGTPAGADMSADIAAVKVDTAATLVDTGTTLPATLSTIEGKVDTVDTVADGIQTDLSNGTDGLGAIKADTAAILVDTADMQPKLGTPAADVSADIAAVKAETALIVADTNELQTDDVPGLIAAQNDISTADVNAQVLDVLNTDTFAEPSQGTPAATATLVQKIGYLYKFLRNRTTSTATTISVYNDDATTVDHKSTHSDDGTTYDRGEFTTGP